VEGSCVSPWKSPSREEAYSHEAARVEEAKEQDADDERVVELRALRSANDGRLPGDLAVLDDEDGRPDWESKAPPVRIHCSAEDEESDSRTIESERGEDGRRDDEVRRGCPVGGDEWASSESSATMDGFLGVKIGGKAGAHEVLSL
jgi:hypothetical protein